MHARKYIRFDSTQELHTRLMSAERCDYRIIARARAPNRSSMRALARGGWPHHNASGCARDPSGRPARTREGSPALPIFSGRLRGSIRLERTHVFVPAERLQAHQTVRRAMRSPSAGVSNRNDALARRNRIFLHRCHHIFVVETLRTRASAPNRAANQAIRRFDSTCSQTPSRFFSASLTACGLALPPVDFIT